MEKLTLEEAIKHAKEVAKTNRAEATYNFPELKEYYDNCSECANQHNQLAEWLEELKSFKEAEEQGLFVRLPDDLNRILYQVNYRWTECTEYGEENNKCEIYDCECECDSRKEYYIAEVDLQYISIGNYYDRLGKFLFITREEAEKKLEEMKKNEQ